jgi:pimeloyl-ACP methyl ester carboxylesterase
MNSIEPFYFGDPEKLLLGCYHDPEPESARDCALLLCYPMGHEYIQFHRACRQLATLLAGAGFPVLRFDFYGCGDSSGECGEGRISQWLADIAAAISELRRRCDTGKVGLIGLRLGGTLSMMAGAERGDIDGMVLWDPVVNGKSYIHELKALHQEMLGIAHLRAKADGLTEILGFSLSDQMLADLGSIDLLAIRQKPANNVLLIDSHEKPQQGLLVEHLKSLRAQVKHLHLPHPQFWTWMEDFSHILVPHQLLQAVIRWLSEVCP